MSIKFDFGASAHSDDVLESNVIAKACGKQFSMRNSCSQELCANYNRKAMTNIALL